MSPRSTRLDGDSVDAGDDSPFLSAADFFSLISLTVIFTLVALAAQQSDGAKEAHAASVGLGGSGPAVAIDDRTAYVAFIGGEDGLLVRVIPGHSQATQERLIAYNEDVDKTVQWIKQKLLDGIPPTEAVVYMDRKEQHGEAHRLFNEAWSSLLPYMPVTPLLSTR